MKQRMLLLIIALPLASVAFGGVMLYLAHSSPDTEITLEQEALSKTSWRAPPQGARR